MDVVDNCYLCYLLPRSEKLAMVRIKGTVPEARSISLNTTPVHIAAKDAVSLKRLNMIAILAPCGTLILYTGPVQVGKVHVAGILSSFVTSTALSTSFGCNSQTLPRRSSLLPSALATQAESHFDEELHMLSPVQPLPTTSNNLASSRLNNCQNIRDGTGNRLTLVFSSEKMFRISLPTMSESQLMSRCLLALREALPKQVALELLIRWYGTRNAPGSRNFSVDREWDIFRTMLFQHMGRPFPPMDGGQQNKSNGSSKSSFDEPKKRRKSENCLGTDQDWEFLLKNTVQQRPVAIDGEAQPKVELVAYDPDKFLFPYIPKILSTLHLVYEDLKLDPLLRSELKLLGECLYELAHDLKIEKLQLY